MKVPVKTWRGRGGRRRERENEREGGRTVACVKQTRCNQRRLLAACLTSFMQHKEKEEEAVNLYLGEESERVQRSPSLPLE